MNLLNPNPMTWLAGTVVAVAAILHGASSASAEANRSVHKETDVMTLQARGPFTVKMAPQGEGDSTDGINTGRMVLDKVFSGDLDAVGKGEMLTARTPVDSSAGYVAIERVTGTLDGRTGSFVLQHSGTMTRDAQSLSISVVPDSGTGQLSGIAGSMTIDRRRAQLQLHLHASDAGVTGADRNVRRDVSPPSAGAAACDGVIHSSATQSCGSLQACATHFVMKPARI